MLGASGFSADRAVGLEQSACDCSGWNCRGLNCNSSDTLTAAIQSQPLNGTLSVVSGNSVNLYTRNPGFSGLDSFTFKLTDTTNSAGPLIGAAATVSLVVSATGVTPALQLNCPAVTYDFNPHGCTTVLAPFVAGTTTVSYNGSNTVPSAAGSYRVSATFVSSGSSSQNTNATGVLVISQATPMLKLLCPTLSFTGSPQGCTVSVVGLGTTAPKWDDRRHVQREFHASDQWRNLCRCRILYQWRSELCEQQHRYVVADDLRAARDHHRK